MIFQQSSEISNFDSLEDVQRAWIRKVFVLASQSLDTVEKIRPEYGRRKAHGFHNEHPWEVYLAISQDFNGRAVRVTARVGGLARTSEKYSLDVPAQDIAEIVVGTVKDTVKEFTQR